MRGFALGLNTWQGEGAPPPPSDAIGLGYFSIDLPDQKAYEETVARVDTAGLPSNQTEAGLLFARSITEWHHPAGVEIKHSERSSDVNQASDVFIRS